MLLSLILPVYVTRVRRHAGRRHADSNKTPAQAELCSPSTLGFKPSHLFWTPMGASSVPHTHAEDELARQSSETLCHSQLPGAHIRDGVTEGFLTHIGSAGHGSQLAGWWLCRVLGAPWVC